MTCLHVSSYSLFSLSQEFMPNECFLPLRAVFTWSVHHMALHANITLSRDMSEESKNACFNNRGQTLFCVEFPEYGLVSSKFFFMEKNMANERSIQNTPSIFFFQHHISRQYVYLLLLTFPKSQASRNMGNTRVVTNRNFVLFVMLLLLHIFFK